MIGSRQWHGHIAGCDRAVSLLLLLTFEMLKPVGLELMGLELMNLLFLACLSVAQLAWLPGSAGPR